MSELTIILKDENRTYKHKSLVYQPFIISENDPIILNAILEAKKNFDGEPEDIIVKVSFIFQ